VADLSSSRGEDASGCRRRLTAGVCMGRQIGLNLSDGGAQGCPQGLQALAHLCCDSSILLINLLLCLQTDTQMLMHASIHSVCILPRAEAGAVLSSSWNAVLTWCLSADICTAVVFACRNTSQKRHEGKSAHLVLLATLGLCKGDCSLENTQHQDSHATGVSRDVPSAAEVASLER